MLSWKIGAVTVTRVVEIELPVAYNPERPFLAEATPEVLKRMMKEGQSPLNSRHEAGASRQQRG